MKRYSVLLVAFAFLLGACENESLLVSDDGATTASDRPFIAYATYPSPGDGQVELELFELCKEYASEAGPMVTFDVSVDAIDDSYDQSFTIQLNDGECQDIWAVTVPGKTATITVTEQVPLGYSASHVITTVVGEGTSPVTAPSVDSNGATASVGSGANLSGALVVFTNTPDEVTGEEGCTPGYWKNHLHNWPEAYQPEDDFDTVFGVDLFSPDISLNDAIRAKGGHENRLARHGTAALLGAAHPDVAFSYTVAEVIALVQAGDADALEAANEQGCPLQGGPPRI